MNYIVPLTLMSISSYYGYYFGKAYLQKYISNWVMEELTNKLNEKQENEEITFHPVERTNSALISYKHGSKDYKICVFFDDTKVRSMLRKEVFLIKDDQRINITHKPGIPYLLSAADIGGNSIIVIKDDEIIKTFNKDEIPKFL